MIRKKPSRTPKTNNDCFVLKNAVLLDKSHSEPVDIVISGNRIMKIQQSSASGKHSARGRKKPLLPDSDFRLHGEIDLKRRIVTPGFIDAHTHVGLGKSDVGAPGEDTNEKSSPVTPEIRALDGIDLEDPAFMDALSGGVTAVMVSPGSANAIGGSCLVTTTGGNPCERILLENAGIKMALGENPKRIHGGAGRQPATRMGTAALIRRTLFEASEYLENIEKQDSDEKTGKSGASVKRNFRYEALRPLILGQVPARIHAHEAYDLETAIRICEEFNISVVLEHSTAAHEIIRKMRHKNHDCIQMQRGEHNTACTGIPSGQSMTLGPLFSTRKKSELRHRSFEAAVELYRQGLKFALITDHPVTGIETLRMSAAYCVSWGLPEEAALASITSVAADILGIGTLTGRIRKGFRADLVIWNAHPFDITRKPEMVLVGGKVAWPAY